MDTEQPYDAAIIGSGIGGLSMGILLAQLGLRTLICERNPSPGGLMRSYRRGGVDLPVGVHYFGAFGEGEPLRRVCDLLGVTKRMEVEQMGQGNPIDRYCFDAFTFDLPVGLDAFMQALEDRFPEERETITALMGNLRTIAAQQNGLAFFAPSPSPLDPTLITPLGTWFTRMNVTPGLRGVLGVAARWMGMSDEECPLFYHHLALVSYLTSSWRLKGSGTALAECFVERFAELGGTLLCGDPAVAILKSGEAVEGIRLASGKVVRTARVVAAIHPKRALAMLPEGAVKPRHYRSVGELTETEGIFAVSALVEAALHPALPYNVFRIITEPSSGTVTDGIFYQWRPGTAGKTLLVAMTRSPYGEWGQWKDTLTGRRGPAYAEAKTLRARHLLGEAGKLFGPLAGVELLDAYTPLTLRDWVDSPEGSPYGLRRSLHQLPLVSALQRLAPKGLWFAGQNALSPGIQGTLLGSLQAVRQMIGPERFAAEIFGPLIGK